MQSVIHVDPEIMHGTPCFKGTRVPISILFDYLAAGRTIEFFLEQYPTVGHAQVIELLSIAKHRLGQRPTAA